MLEFLLEKLLQNHEYLLNVFLAIVNRRRVLIDNINFLQVIRVLVCWDQISHQLCKHDAIPFGVLRQCNEVKLAAKEWMELNMMQTFLNEIRVCVFKGERLGFSSQRIVDCFVMVVLWLRALIGACV